MISKYKITIATIIYLLSAASITLAEFKASDHDGFQRPKEIKIDPNKANQEIEKKEDAVSSNEQNEKKRSVYEDMDGFKRPKKDQ